MDITYKSALDDNRNVAMVIYNIALAKGLMSGTLDPSNPTTKEAIEALDKALDTLLGKEDLMFIPKGSPLT